MAVLTAFEGVTDSQWAITITVMIAGDQHAMGPLERAFHNLYLEES